MKILTPEIVAPAGNAECFTSALNAGADAIYAGADGLNMRASADSFSGSDIKKMTQAAHEKDKKFYLALNIIVYRQDFDAVNKILDDASGADVDAIICWDPAVIRAARERGLRIHISTQASVSNIEAVKFYHDAGAERIVLARELDIADITNIVSETKELGLNMEYECFVHGAMCLAVSGRCLMSHFIHGKSANRGECWQPCRRKYRIYDYERDIELAIDSHTIMSAKDLCTIDILDRVMGTGINALKIEGRMRDSSYVKKTVEIYKAARESVLKGSFSPEKASGFKMELEKVFNRGFSHGFYLTRPDNDISNAEGSVSKDIRLYMGKIVNYYNMHGAADIILESGNISIGDILQITGPTTGIMETKVESMRDMNNKPVDNALKGNIVGLKIPGKAREGDKVFVVQQRDDI